MPDIFTRKKRSEVMREIRSKDTKPELAVRRFLFSSGFRYRLHGNMLPGKPDIVLPKYETVVFVNGCFWHGHTCKIGSGSRKPKTHAEYWNRKISKNIKRDRNDMQQLHDLGWNVIVIWECETSKREILHEKLSRLFERKGFNNA